MTMHLDVDATIYGPDAVLRACYRFTDRAYLLIERVDGSKLRIRITGRSGENDEGIAGELSNALLDEQLRGAIAAETRVVRELIYRQAFAEAELE
jgi:His-Xaa-Ser system protein HxsD